VAETEQARAALAGVYTLTINLSEQCLPDAVRRRTYQAIIEASPYQYLGITT